MARVLVIDGDEAICDALCTLLEMEGHTASSIADPGTAIDYLLTSPQYHIVIFDASRPWAGDTRIAALIAATDPRLLRHAYICVTTTPTQVPPQRAELERRSIPILPKPFELETLLMCVTQQVEQLSTPLPELPTPTGNLFVIDLAAIERRTMKRIAQSWDCVERTGLIVRRMQARLADRGLAATCAAGR